MSLAKDKAELVVLIFSGILYILLFPPTVFESTVSDSRITFLCIAVFILTISVSKRPLVYPFLVVALLFFALLSSLWATSVVSVLISTATFVSIFLVAVGFSPYFRQVLTSLFAAFVALTITNFLLWVPFVFDASNTGKDFSGIYSNPNSLGFVIISGLPVLGYFMLKSWRFSVVSIAIAGLGLVLIIVSKSETALFTFAAVTLSFFVLHISKLPKALPQLLIMFTSLTLLALLVYIPSLLIYMGKDPTISGRTQLWEMVWREISVNPIVGMGWSNSWPESSRIYIEVMNQEAPLHHAHNEILNWLLTLGIFGAVLVLLIYLATVLGGVEALNRGQTQLGTWVVLSSVAFFVRGLSDISETNAQGWFLLMLAFSAVTYSLNPQIKSTIQFSRWPGTKPYGAKILAKHW